MNFIQKLISSFRHPTKAQIREARRIVLRDIKSYRQWSSANAPGWQAAAVNRLTNYWTTQNLSVDSTLRTQLCELRARSRNLCENNDYARGALGIFKSNVIGENGIQLKNKARDLPRGADQSMGPLDQFANRIIEDAWWNWNKHGNCTVDRSLCGTDRQNLCIETAARDGEVLIRKIRGFNNDARFAIQIVETDYLDFDYQDTLENGNEVRMGVELNRFREPVAYYLLRKHPNDQYFNAAATLLDRHIRVPKEEMLHAFIRFRPEQTRGVPWMATAMFRMSVVGKYEESEAIAARLAASKIGVIEKDVPNDYQGDDDGMGNKLMDVEPGCFEELPPGMRVKPVSWEHPNSSYQMFMKTALRGVATGLGLSYNTFANDMESVNFASGKLGIEAEREIFKALQQWYIWNIENNLFEEWLDVQLLTQAIPLPYSKFAKFNAPDWRPRRWSYMNPEQEVKADILAINSGTSSISRVLAKNGIDRDELFDEIQDDKEAAAARGLTFSEILTEPDPAGPASGSGSDPGNTY